MLELAITIRQNSTGVGTHFRLMTRAGTLAHDGKDRRPKDQTPLGMTTGSRTGEACKGKDP